MKFIGIDIAKSTFVAAYPLQSGGYRTKTYPNDPKGVALFMKSFSQEGHHCVLEATGNYGMLLLYMLCRAGVAVSQVNPKQIKHFARMMMMVTKTDNVDAKLISLYGEKMSPPVYRLPAESLLILKQKKVQGNVEEPGFYLGSDSSARMAVDNLLLTQGWVRYDQSLLSKVAKFNHQREPFFRIAGTVKNGFGKPLANTEIALAAIGKTPFTMDTVSDENGIFRFEHFPPFDTLGFIIQARNRRGRSFNVGVELAPDVERMVTPRINWQAAERLPWYVNLDCSTQRAVATQREHLRNTLFGPEGGDIRVVMLEEATVTGWRAVRGSKNLNGPGNADQVIGEEELMEQGTKTLMQVLAERVDGFEVGRFPRSRSGKPAYMVDGRPLKIMFDGMDIDRFYDPLEGVPDNDHLLFVKGCLEGYTVDELVGVEVMASTSYSSRYNSYVLPALDLVAPSGQEQLAQVGTGSINPLSKTSAVMGLNPVYIEVTTRAGLGLYNRTKPGLVHFKPMPFVWPREFYKPRYAAGAPDNDLPDFRSTIHWEPFIITDEYGEATISFYAGDLPGTYTVTIQGLDDSGNLGVLYTQLPVAN